MTILREILGLMEIKDAHIRKDAEMMARKMAANVVMTWKPSPDILPKFIKTQLQSSGYRIFDTMDYENMKELPENPNFIFDPLGNDFKRYFGITSLEEKIEIPHQTKGDLVTIVLGKSPIEKDAVYIVGSGGTIDRIKAVKGNEPINKPILYASIRGHIQIIIPTNLIYSK